jgi:glycosyltransferase involved in cell wall biosynthesis
MLKENKKAVHISTVHHPFDPRIYHKECKSLAEAGYDVTLIISDHKDLANHIDEKVNIIALKRSSNRFFRMIKSSYLAYKTAKKLNADFYHFHDPELIFVGWLLKNQNNTVIYDVHEDYETSIRQKTYLPRIVARTMAKIYRYIEKKVTSNFEICLAEKYYAEKFPEGQTVLNYPLLEDFGDIAAAEDRTEIDVPQTINLIYTGNITKDRGALIHADLVNLDEKLRVYYVGKCPRELADEIYDIAGKNKQRVVVEGIDKYIPREQINKFYKEGNWTAGLALFPPTEHYLKKELTKFFEYMNAGIPIICSNFPVWKQFIEFHKCGIAVDPYNHDEIIKAVRYLADNPKEAQEMGENGRVAVTSYLNWNVEKKKLIEWYAQISKK